MSSLVAEGYSVVLLKALRGSVRRSEVSPA